MSVAQAHDDPYGRLTKDRVPGASGWRTPGGRWRFLRVARVTGHPMGGRWLVYEREADDFPTRRWGGHAEGMALDGYFSHDIDFATLAECREHASG